MVFYVWEVFLYEQYGLQWIGDIGEQGVFGGGFFEEVVLFYVVLVDVCEDVDLFIGFDCGIYYCCDL